MLFSAGTRVRSHGRSSARKAAELTRICRPGVCCSARHPSQKEDVEGTPLKQRALRIAVALFAAAFQVVWQPVAIATPAPDDDLVELSNEAWTGGEREFRPLTRAEAERKRYLFTDDAFEGMLALSSYAEYVDIVVKPLEKSPGCQLCEKNRTKLERAWQTVANEMYIPMSRGGFSQALWGQELERVLREAGGALETTEETDVALKAVVAKIGDPYSAYLPGPDFRRALRRPLPVEREYLQRQFVGVGLQLGEPCAAGWTVEAPLAGSPAEEAGIRRGDWLQSVDGVSVRGLAKKDVESLLRGPSGSTADLSITSAVAAEGQVKGDVRSSSGSSRRGFWLGPSPRPLLPQPQAQPQAQALSLERRELPLPPVQWTRLAVQESGDLVEYLRINYFSSEGTKVLARAIMEGESLGVDGFIVDVRNNPGGILEEGIASASLFLPCGSKVAQIIRGEDAPDITYITCRLPSGQFEDLPVQLTTAPVAVLANASSASASEVFAAALRDNGRGPIVGERTFGKGLVQFFFPLGDGSGLKLSVLKWRSPDGSDTDAQRGLLPDVPCSDFPRGAVKGGGVDACILEAERRLAAATTTPAGSSSRAAVGL